MSMEKRGVVSDENEAPAKQAADKGSCLPNCCKQACGTDLMSKAAEAVADKAAKDKQVITKDDVGQMPDVFGK